MVPPLTTSTKDLESLRFACSSTTFLVVAPNCRTSATVAWKPKWGCSECPSLTHIYLRRVGLFSSVLSWARPTFVGPAWSWTVGPKLSHLVLRSKLNAHSICAQEPVFTYTVQNVNIENQCLKYINFITWIIVYTRRLGRLSHRVAAENSNPIGNRPRAMHASRRNLHRRSPSHLELLSTITARVSRLMVATQQVWETIEYESHIIRIKL
jgi:hypothetical protein